FRCEVGRGGLPMYYGAGLSQSRDRRAILIPGLIRIDQTGAPSGWEAACQDDILDGDGHTVQEAERATACPARLCLGGGGQGSFAIYQHEGLQQRIKPLNPRENGFCDFERGKAPGLEGAYQFGGGQPGDLVASQAWGIPLRTAVHFHAGPWSSRASLTTKMRSSSCTNMKRPMPSALNRMTAMNMAAVSRVDCTWIMR